MGKESEIYIYIYIYPFAIYLKLIHHFKLNVLYIKFRKWNGEVIP